MAIDKPIQDAEKLVLDLITDYLNSRSLVGANKLGAFFNLIGDLEIVIPELSQLGASVKQIQISDAASMLAQIVTSLSLSGKSAGIAQAVIKLLEDSAPLVSDVEALISAIKAS